MNTNISPIGITGGPCAGKTTIMAYLLKELSDRGYQVLIVPESATLSFSTGVHPGIHGEEFQKLVLSIMCHLEQTLLQIAKQSTQKTVILCDRGVMDMLAYIDTESAIRIAKTVGVNLQEYRDSFYKAIVHLQTAAYGAESFYTLENNTARTETIEQARILDDRVKKAWIGHPKLISITNEYESFEQKKLATLQAICSVLGIPEPIEDERKFSVSSFIRPGDIAEYSVKVEIYQDYLVNDTKGSSERVRKRGTRQAWVYTHTIKEKIKGTSAEIERERIISKSEYLRLLRRKNNVMSTIIKDRYCFMYKSQYFEMDFFKKPVSDLVLLELELTKQTREVHLPPFLEGNVREVTGIKEFKNEYIARKK